MHRRSVLVVALALVFSIAFTTASKTTVDVSDEDNHQLDERARAVTAGCEKELKNLFSNSFDLGVCLGVLKGLHYLSADVCVPPALTLSDVAGVLTRYFAVHPTDDRADFRERSLEALRAVWPCRGRLRI